MQALMKSLNELCDALPFQTSFYVKDLTTGARGDRFGQRAGAVGQYPEDLDPDGGAGRGPRRQAQPRPEGDDRVEVPGQRLRDVPAPDAGLRDHAARRDGDDDHRQRQHVHGDRRRSRGAGRDPALVRVDRHDRHHASLRHPAQARSRPHARAGDHDHAQRSGAAARADSAGHHRRRPSRVSWAARPSCAGSASISSAGRS